VGGDDSTDQLDGEDNVEHNQDGTVKVVPRLHYLEKSLDFLCARHVKTGTDPRPASALQPGYAYLKSLLDGVRAQEGGAQYLRKEFLPKILWAIAPSDTGRETDKKLIKRADGSWLELARGKFMYNALCFIYIVSAPSTLHNPKFWQCSLFFPSFSHHPPPCPLSDLHIFI
jgi:hypothetical protein